MANDRSATGRRAGRGRAGVNALGARRIVAALAFVLLAAQAAGGHPLAPALLELHEHAGGRAEVRFKISALQPPGRAPTAHLPAHCRPLAEPERRHTGDAVLTRWEIDCGAAGLVGATVAVDGLDGAGIDALVRVTLADGRVVRGVLRAAAPAFVVPAREAPLAIARAYAWLGIEHILGGVDHLLFVAGLLLLVRAPRQLVATVTAFTAGHSITLALAALGLVRVPTGPVELAIALSVFWLAVELARAPEAPASALRRRPWLLAGAFGLLHGLGFAGALQEIGLPAGDVPLALAAFNAGIEVGQLAFVAVWLAAAAALARLPLRAPAWLRTVPLYAMGTLAAFWCFERGAALLR